MNLERTSVRFEPSDASQPLDPEVLGMGDFEVVNPPYGLRLRCRVKWESPSFFEVAVALTVPRRDADERFQVVLVESYSLATLNARSGPEIARDLIRRAVLHELDESLYVGGKRAFDPHAGGPTAPSRF